MKYHINFIIILIFFTSVNASNNVEESKSVTCRGEFPNPITDLCWKCMLPIKIGGVDVTSVGEDNKDITNLTSKKPICYCQNKKTRILEAGIPISFWEPVRMVDVTKTPMCFVLLGGISMGSGNDRGNVDIKSKTAYYHAHWYANPILTLLNLVSNLKCLEKLSFDLAYMTEIDPLWNDDTKSAIINPESLLFGNKLASVACIGDCVASSGGLSLDKLFWCSGCQGGIYPFTGTIAGYNGGVGASVLIMTKLIAKLHRQLLLSGYTGDEALCGKYLCPIIKKSQYRYQMLFPVVETKSCKRIGQSEILWQAGREFPVQGEDFGYMIWRNRDCCMSFDSSFGAGD